MSSITKFRTKIRQGGKKTKAHRKKPKVCRRKSKVLHRESKKRINRKQRKTYKGGSGMRITDLKKESFNSLSRVPPRTLRWLALSGATGHPLIDRPRSDRSSGSDLSLSSLSKPWSAASPRTNRQSRSSSSSASSSPSSVAWSQDSIPDATTVWNPEEKIYEHMSHVFDRAAAAAGEPYSIEQEEEEEGEEGEKLLKLANAAYNRRCEALRLAPWRLRNMLLAREQVKYNRCSAPLPRRAASNPTNTRFVPLPRRAASLCRAATRRDAAASPSRKHHRLRRTHG